MNADIQRLSLLLKRLFAVSQKQMDALHRLDLSEFEAAMKTKDELLQSIGRVLGRCSAKGIALMNPQTHPADPTLRAELSLSATELRRFNAHEKALTSQVTTLRDDIRCRLLSLQKRRTGLAGYSQPRKNGHCLATTG
ncbi:MAG: hypothetical protein V1784_02900 [bacterium]